MAKHFLSAGQAYFEGPDNRFSGFLGAGDSCEAVNAQLAHYLVGKIARNSIEVLPKRWTNCYLLNEGCFAYMRFFEFALRTSKAFKAVVFGVVSAREVARGRP